MIRWGLRLRYYITFYYFKNVEFRSTIHNVECRM